MDKNGTYRIMISGGGTGGHIYPAISIGQSLKAALNDVEVLYVGAKGKMEMKKVPEAGFKIVGLNITGIQRKLSFQNILFPFRLIKSIWDSFRLIKDFKPHAVVGVGGYASGPLLYAASRKKIPTLIQEQNSYAGLTNKWLSGKVNKICVAYENMSRYFPGEKLVLTGNPVRTDLVLPHDQYPSALQYFNIDKDRDVILILGGSLGARSVNEAVLKALPEWIDSGVQVIWQTGGFYYKEMLKRSSELDLSNIRIMDFIKEMKYAYAAADIVISRAGALSIAELMITAKPSILIPSPNVAEDHQTKNAVALVENDAAVMIQDNEAVKVLAEESLSFVRNKELRKNISANISKMAKPNASRDIANEVIKLFAA